MAVEQASFKSIFLTSYTKIMRSCNHLLIPPRLLPHPSRPPPGLFVNFPVNFAKLKKRTDNELARLGSVFNEPVTSQDIQLEAVIARFGSVQFMGYVSRNQPLLGSLPAKNRRPTIRQNVQNHIRDQISPTSNIVEPHQKHHEEHLDILTRTGRKTGISKPRGQVHRDGDYHRAVHVWIYSESTAELLVQRRADCKDSWPGQWDISTAGHISVGDSSLSSARRELEEELGISLPNDAFELLFVFRQECVINNGTFINNEFNDVYLVTTLEPIPLEAFTLQESEVSAVRYVPIVEYKSALARGDEQYVSYDVDAGYGQLFTIIEERYKENIKTHSLSLQKQINRYAAIYLEPELTGLSERDKEALVYILQASMVMDDIFYEQTNWDSNPALRDWLKGNSSAPSVSRLNWLYYSINKSPWCCLDENKAFLTTADSTVKLLPDAISIRPVLGWKGLEYKAAFPVEQVKYVEQAIEGLSREILTIQAKGDKVSAELLLKCYASITQPLKDALEKIENVLVPDDIAPVLSGK